MTHAEATVDRDHRARDVPGVGAGEELDHAGDLVGRCGALERDGGDDRRHPILAEGAGHVGLDRAGGDDVDGDAARPELACERTGEPDESYVGFIAEDVPALVATADRNGVSSMDVVAVLTRVIQDQQRRIEELETRLQSRQDP